MAIKVKVWSLVTRSDNDQWWSHRSTISTGSTSTTTSTGSTQAKVQLQKPTHTPSAHKCLMLQLPLNVASCQLLLLLLLPVAVASCRCPLHPWSALPVLVAHSCNLLWSRPADNTLDWWRQSPRPATCFRGLGELRVSTPTCDGGTF